jgi:hypothetical protein
MCACGDCAQLIRIDNSATAIRGAPIEFAHSRLKELQLQPSKGKANAPPLAGDGAL